MFSLSPISLCIIAQVLGLHSPELCHGLGISHLTQYLSNDLLVNRLLSCLDCSFYLGNDKEFEKVFIAELGS